MLELNHERPLTIARPSLVLASITMFIIFSTKVASPFGNSPLKGQLLSDLLEAGYLPEFGTQIGSSDCGAQFSIPTSLMMAPFTKVYVSMISLTPANLLWKSA